MQGPRECGLGRLGGHVEEQGKSKVAAGGMEGWFAP